MGVGSGDPWTLAVTTHAGRYAPLQDRDSGVRDSAMSVTAHSEAPVPPCYPHQGEDACQGCRAAERRIERRTYLCISRRANGSLPGAARFGSEIYHASPASTVFRPVLPSPEVEALPPKSQAWQREISKATVSS